MNEVVWFCVSGCREDERGRPHDGEVHSVPPVECTLCHRRDGHPCVNGDRRGLSDSRKNPVKGYLRRYQESPPSPPLHRKRYGTELVTPVNR